MRATNVTIHVVPDDAFDGASRFLRHRRWHTRERERQRQKRPEQHTSHEPDLQTAESQGVRPAGTTLNRHPHRYRAEHTLVTGPESGCLHTP